MIDSALTNANILIVDTLEANIDILEGFLEMLGYVNIKSTTDSRQVITLFKSYKPDIILLDLMMPHLNGFEVMERLKDMIPRGDYLPILVLTGDIAVEEKQLALKVGASDFLTRPFDLTEVGLRVHNLLFTGYLQQQILVQNQRLEEKVKESILDFQKINQELTAARDRAEASDRLKTAFIRNISHEIRTPLNGILGFSDLLIDPTITNDEKQEFISLIQSSSNRLLNTIEDYVNIALIVSGNMRINYETVDVDSILKESEYLFRDKIEAKGLELILSIASDVNGVTIETDLELFKRILCHLLDNAIKFTYKGTIVLGYTLKPDFVEFFVKDTGIGVEDEVKEKIVEIFMQDDFSANRGHEGNGLGLSIVKGLLMLLGGDIRMKSVKGEGSVFYFTLPIKSTSV